MNRTFKENVIQECPNCVVRDECTLVKTGFCPLEIDIYERFMKALEEEYENVTEVNKMLAEQLIANIIYANRVSRHIKLKGLTQKVVIHTPEGEVKEYDQENILKQGMHLDINRIIRLFKEMKLTPKESSPTKKQYDIRQMIVHASKESFGDKSVPAIQTGRKRKVVLPSL